MKYTIKNKISGEVCEGCGGETAEEAFANFCRISGLSPDRACMEVSVIPEQMIEDRARRVEAQAKDEAKLKALAERDREYCRYMAECKADAMKLLDQGHWPAALASMVEDLRAHPLTAELPFIDAWFSCRNEHDARDFITGFRDHF